MEKAVIIEKLRTLMGSWAISSRGMKNTADTLYPPDSDGVVPWENKSLHFTANTQNNCVLALNTFVNELEAT